MFHIIRANLSRYWRSWRLERRYSDLRVSHPVLWDYDEIGQIELGNEVTIGAFSELAILSRAPLGTVPGRLKIGNRSQIGSGCNIRACGGTIEIGDNCILAQQVSIVAANHEIRPDAIYRDLPWDTRRHGVTLAANVWVGAGVTILPGCRIGENAIIAAGSVVTKSVPANEIWGNIPARMIRRIGSEQ